jgi:hypothetical protein
VKLGISKFTFSTSSSMRDIGVDVASNEWLQNFTTRADHRVVTRTIVDGWTDDGRWVVRDLDAL